MDIDTFRSSPSGRLVRTLCEKWAFVPHPLPPSFDWDTALVAALSEADRALGELAGVGRTLIDPHLLGRPLVRREAVLSARMEGIQASVSDLYAYESMRLSLYAPEAEVRGVYNGVNALEYGRERLLSCALSLRLICELHGLLMDGLQGERQAPGAFRTRQNWIGAPGCRLSEALYVPPPVNEMQPALDAWEQFVQAETSLPPLIRLGLIHYQFEAIHPFLDGSGRIGRLLIPLLLCAWDLLPRPWLCLSAYFHAHRDRYDELRLAICREGTWAAWLTFFLHGVAAESRDAVARIRRLQDLREQYREQFQAARAAARLLQVVDLLFAQPVLTVRRVEVTLKVTYNTAQQYVQQLEEAGLLREVTGQDRNRVYQADEVLKAVQVPL